MKNFIILLLFIFSNYSYSQLPNTISNEDKIYGLSKFWQEVNYNFVYFNKVNKKEWNDTYKNLISNVQKTKNDYEYYKLLQKFCAILKDGHTNVWFPKEIQDRVFVTDFGDYKFTLSNIEGKAIITKVNMEKLKELPIGSEIMNVNGVPTEQYLEENVRPYISSSTNHILEDSSIKYLLQSYEGTEFIIKIKLPNDEINSLKLTSGKSKENNLSLSEKNEILEFKWLNKDIAYLAINSFNNWEIMDLFESKISDIKKAKKLVIDIRKNTGGDGNIAREIFKYLTNDTILYGSKSKSRENVSYFKAIGKHIVPSDTINNNWSKRAFLTHNNNYYYDFPYHPYSTKDLDIERVELPTVILIGHNTASAAEDFLIYADNQENIIKIGEKTFGSTGQPMSFEMPGGGIARVCTKKDTYPDNREFVGIGIEPDIEVKYTLADYLENKDVVLEQAIKYLNKI